MELHEFHLGPARKLSTNLYYISQTEPGWNSMSSILVLLEKCLQTCMTYTIAEYTVNTFLMMDRGTARNM